MVVPPSPGNVTFVPTPGVEYVPPGNAPVQPMRFHKVPFVVMSACVGTTVVVKLRATKGRVIISNRIEFSVVVYVSMAAPSILTVSNVVNVKFM